MFENDQIEEDLMCIDTPRNNKLMYLLVGGGIGAAIALLFAPKPGREVRRDLAETALRGYDESLAAATRMRGKAVDYYGAAKEKGTEMRIVLAQTASELIDEIADDAHKVSEIIQSGADRMARSF